MTSAGVMWAEQRDSPRVPACSRLKKRLRATARPPLETQGVRVSMDGQGRWIDNVFVERLWRSVKYEEIYLHAYETPRGEGRADELLQCL